MTRWLAQRVVSHAHSPTPILFHAAHNSHLVRPPSSSTFVSHRNAETKTSFKQCVYHPQNTIEHTETAFPGQYRAASARRRGWCVQGYCHHSTRTVPCFTLKRAASYSANHTAFSAASGSSGSRTGATGEERGVPGADRAAPPPAPPAPPAALLGRRAVTGMASLAARNA